VVVPSKFERKRKKGRSSLPRHIKKKGKRQNGKETSRLTAGKSRMMREHTTPKKRPEEE